MVETAPELIGGEQQQQAYANELKQEGARVALYRRYEEGQHRAVITDQMRKLLRLETDDTNINDFTDNYCTLIVDKMAGRLNVINVSLDSPESTENWLNPLLEDNNWEALQSYMYRSAVRDGYSYITDWFNYKGFTYIAK